MMTVFQLKNEINTLKGRIIAIENKKTFNNIPELVREILNLEQGSGNGFIPAEYPSYGSNIYSSSIKGVKSIRFSDNVGTVEVSIVSPSGYLIPDHIAIEGKTYNMRFVKDDHYSDKIDY